MTYFAYDDRGNVTTLTNSQGAVVGSYAYDAWGKTTASSGTHAQDNPYRYATKEALAGMSFFGFRFYSAGTGRWLNRDPLEEDGGINLYEGMGNDPVNGEDEYGLAPAKKLYAVYAKINHATKQVYIGRTSGYGTMESIIRARDSSHHMSLKGFGPSIPIGSTNNYNAIRGIEQIGIDRYGGVGGKIIRGWSSENSIRGIALAKMTKRPYIAAAGKVFGKSSGKLGVLFRGVDSVLGKPMLLLEFVDPEALLKAAMGYRYDPCKKQWLPPDGSRYGGVA